jgi:aminoglycoside phosphotransferase (APT) family kinase protein
MRWLTDPSEASVRQAIAATLPELANAAVELSPELETSNPEWCASTAIVGGSFLLKFAWSEAAAKRVHREACVLQTLADAAPHLPIARLAGSSDDPVAFSTYLVAGRPLRFGSRHVSNSERASIAVQLAVFLAALHRPAVLQVVRDRVPAVVTPEPQGATPAIRERLSHFLDRRRMDLVLAWCDWVDEVLGTPSSTQSFVHGDLHGFNQVWDRSTWTLRLVADFEMAGPADAEYDLRYLPPMEPTLALVEAVRERYEALSGRTLAMSRIMAWHVRTALGDALWRSEAGIPLPGGSTPASYVDDLAKKLPEVMN